MPCPQGTVQDVLLGQLLHAKNKSPRRKSEVWSGVKANFCSVCVYIDCHEFLNWQNQHLTLNKQHVALGQTGRLCEFWPS